MPHSIPSTCVTPATPGQQVSATAEESRGPQRVRSGRQHGPSAFSSGLGRALSAAALVVCATVATSDADAAGTVTGKVYDARTGSSISSARVRVDGTNVSGVTDTDGTYRLKNVPAGDVQLVVEYGGSTREVLSVEVADGIEIKQNVGLKVRGTDQNLDDDAVFELSAFEVNGLSEFNAHVMAVSEERYSTEMKDVVSAEQFGDNTDGNLGEFVKFLPGVLVEYGAGSYGNGADAGAVGIRGFGAEQTAIMVDGVPISGSTPGSLTRAVGLDMISVNNASRIEVSKIATPDMPDGAVGGTINLITRTAFEYPKAQFNWRTYLTANSDNISFDHFFSKTPGPTNKETFKAQPGFDFSYVKPINEKLGFSFNGQYSQQYNENHTSKAQWDYDVGDQHPVTKEWNDVTNPFLKTISITDAPRLSTRTGIGAKLDWRPAEGHSFTFNVNTSKFEGTDSNRRLQVGPNRASDWGSNGDGTGFVESQTNNGKTDMNIDFLDREGSSIGGYVKYNMDKGPWRIDVVASTSSSRSSLESASNGHFSVVELGSTGVGRMYLDNIRDGIPLDIEIFDRDGEAFNLYDISNYRVNDLEEADDGGSNLIVRAGQSDQKSVKNTYKIDVSRDLDFISSDVIRLSAKAGFYREEVKEEKWGKGVNYSYRYTGPVDAFDASVYADDVYVEQDPGFGFSPMTWIDPYKIFSFYEANPTYFNDTEDIPVNGLSMAAENYNQYVNNNKDITETKDSYYAQFEGKMLNGKLSFITGARATESSLSGRGPFQNSDWELIKNDEGQVWYYQQQNGDGVPQFNSDGTPKLAALKITDDNTNRAQYIKDAAAADGIDLSYRVTKNTLAAKQLEYQPLYEVSSKTKTDPAYSFTTAYEITPKLTARFSYGHSNGSPDYEGDGLLTKVQYNEDADGYGGSIAVGNPALEPWVADSFDYQLAYYTDLGGKIKVSYFTKNVENYTVNESVYVDSLQTLADFDLNEDDYYVDSGWTINTVKNGEGTSTTKGYEFEINQSLGLLGDFGSKFNVYGSYTTKKVNQEETSRVEQTPDDSAGAGISFRSGRFRADVRAVYRSEQVRKFTQVRLLTDPLDKNSRRMYPDDYFDPDLAGSEWKVQLYYREPAETKVDVNLNYQLNDKYGIFYSARNVTNTQSKLEVFDDEGLLPDYINMEQIKDFGFNMQLGVRGTF